MRIATYTRISTDEEHQPYSLSAQSDRLGKYIDSQEDWHLVREFSDQMSGASLERPGLMRALGEACARRFDLLLVYRVDRLSRSVRGLAQILEELDRANAGFRSATEPFDTTTPAGRMMVQMLGVFAEFERATIIDRVIAGMERKASRGGWCGGQRPFGYDIDREHDCLAVNEDEAPVVPVIFRMYAQERLGARAIGNRLNDRGRRTRHGRLWSHASVLTVLRNRAYLGEIFFRGAHYPATHPSLVDPAIFEAAQVLLQERGEDRSLRRSNSSDYLLSGLVFCARCGKHYVGAAAHGRSARYSYYVCHSRQRYGLSSCSSDRLPAEELDEAVLGALCETYERTDLVTEALQRAAEALNAGRPDLMQELGAVESDIAKGEAAVDRYLNAFEAGTLSESQLGPRVEKLSKQLAELRWRKEEIQGQLENDVVGHPDPVQLDALRLQLRHVLTHGQTPTRKAVMRALTHRVTVKDRKQVYPTFRLSVDAVRIVDGVAAPTGFEPVSPP